MPHIFFQEFTKKKVIILTSCTPIDFIPQVSSSQHVPPTISFSSPQPISSIPPRIPGLLEAIAIGVGLSILAVSIIVGNLVVLRVYFHNKSLQVSKHFYILSLAIADLAVGLFPLNLFIGYMISGKWPFGGKLCSAWLSLDHILFTVSNVSVLTIAFDRYLCICHPIYYQNNRLNSKKSSIGAVLLSWAVSVLIWAPAIIIYPRVNDVKFDPYRCKVIFYQYDLSLTVFVVIFSFFVPVLVLVCFYTAVFRKISFGLTTMTTTKTQRKTKNNTSTPAVSYSQFKDNRVTPQEDETVSVAIQTKVPSILISDVSEVPKVAIKMKVKNDEEIEVVTNKENHLKRSTTTHMAYNQNTGRRHYVKHNKRASKLLLLVTIAFTLCWLPYHVAVLVEAATKYSFSDGLWNICYMIGKLNSLLNPFCYAIGHTKFKKGFKNTFKCFFNTRE